MINILNSNTIKFFEAYNIINIDNITNIEKVSQLYNEVFWSIFSEEELSEILIGNIEDIIFYNEHIFIDKDTNEQVWLFDILINSKPIFIDNTNKWLLYTYLDDVGIGKNLRWIDIYDINENKLHTNEKILLIWDLSKFIQKNIFLHLFRSLYIDDIWDIINAFHLRFFNYHEYYNMAQDSIFWKKVLENTTRYEDIYMEKVDWQLLMIYKYNNNVYFQSKWAIVTLYDIQNNNLDMNWVFWWLIKLYRSNNLDLSIFNNIPDWISYHFEALLNSNPIVQEYKEPWLYLLWWRLINSFSFILPTQYWYNSFKSAYEDIFEELITNISSNGNVLVKPIIIANNMVLAEQEIKDIRNPYHDLENKDYIIEWFVLSKWFMFLKIKNYQYFIKKLMKSFSYKKQSQILKGISGMLRNNYKDLEYYTKEIINSWKIFSDNHYLNQQVEEIKSLRRNRPLKMSYIRFLKYISNTKSIEEIEYITNNFWNRQFIIDEYKDFLVLSFINTISSMLTSDREEISSLPKILWIPEDMIDINDKDIKNIVKDFIIQQINNNWEKETYFIENVNVIINDILNIEV